MENSATARLRATAFAAAICLAGTSPPASRADDDLSGWLLASAFAPLPGDAAIHRYPELAHLSPGALSSVASLPGGPSRASRGPRPEVVRRKSPFFSLSFEEFDDLLRDVETRHLEFILSLEDTESDESFSFAVPRSLSPSVGVASRFEARLDVSESFRRRGDVYSIDTRMNSRGSLQNIAGSRWRVDGSGTFRYRDGAVPWELTEGEEPRFDLHEISALRRFDGGSVRFGRQRLGRFSRLGHLDGVGGEMTISEVFRVGAAVGFRPDRRDRSPSVDEPTALTYFSAEIAPGKSFNFASTFGLLGSVYQGKPDRLAILVKQSAYLGPKLSFHSTSEVDLHVADPESTSGPRVTVTKLRMVSRITPFLSFEGGVDHHKRPDTRAERELASD
ncbi:MAG: hypothetical protein O7J95_02270, partial [Planctomycetota bacterium]|nr:hypothetical protein [Planctomycetota bacterium]